MRARYITILGSIAITLVMTMTMLFVAHRVILDQFAFHEHTHARESMERTTRLLDDELQNLSRTVKDYGTWDDTYRFMKDHNPEYLRSNYTDISFQNLKLRLVLLLDEKGQIVFRHSRRDGREELAADLTRLNTAAQLLVKQGAADSVAGIVLFEDGPVLVSIGPILTTDEQGPARGKLMMVRDIDYRLLAKLSSLMATSVVIRRNELPAEKLQRINEHAIISSGVVTTSPIDNFNLLGSTRLYDLWGNPLLTMQLMLTRGVWQSGQHAVAVLMYSIVILGCIFGGLNLFMVEKFFVSRVEKLTRFAQQIGTEQGLSARVEISGNDELSQLGNQMNQMLEELNLSREKLIVAQERLHHEATHDSLTGIWNRAAALELLDREIARGEREGSTVAVLMLDADRFKDVNDRYGHAAGDRVLQGITASITRILRNFDILARYGGEEFLVIAPNCTLVEAQGLAERILLRLQSTPTEIGEHQVRVTVSIGIAAGSFPFSSEELIALADRALYRAKENGRNRMESEEALPVPVKGALYSMPRRNV